MTTIKKLLLLLALTLTFTGARAQEPADGFDFVQQFFAALDSAEEPTPVLEAHLTANALKYLADHYEYECGEEPCYASWLLYQDGSLDDWTFKGRNVSKMDKHQYVIDSFIDCPEGEKKFEFSLILTRKSGEYKIDKILPIVPMDKIGQMKF